MYLIRDHSIEMSDFFMSGFTNVSEIPEVSNSVLILGDKDLLKM